MSYPAPARRAACLLVVGNSELEVHINARISISIYSCKRSKVPAAAAVNLSQNAQNLDLYIVLGIGNIKSMDKGTPEKVGGGRRR